jgi:hypothetical protein
MSVFVSLYPPSRVFGLLGVYSAHKRRSESPDDLNIDNPMQTEGAVRGILTSLTKSSFTQISFCLIDILINFDASNLIKKVK